MTKRARHGCFVHGSSSNMPVISRLGNPRVCCDNRSLALGGIIKSVRHVMVTVQAAQKRQRLMRACRASHSGKAGRHIKAGHHPWIKIVNSALSHHGILSHPHVHSSRSTSLFAIAPEMMTASLPAFLLAWRGAHSPNSKAMLTVVQTSRLCLSGNAANSIHPWRRPGDRNIVKIVLPSLAIVRAALTAGGVLEQAAAHTIAQPSSISGPESQHAAS